MVTIATAVNNKSPNFYKTYLKGEFSFGFWNVTARIIGFFVTLATLSYLTVYQYGVFQLILASFAGAAIFIGLGGETIRNDILRYIGEGSHGFAKRLFLESTVVRVVIGLILFGVIFFGADSLFSNYGPEFIKYIKIISFLFIHDAIWPSIRQILETEKKFSIIASRAALSKIIQLGVLGFYFIFYSISLGEIIISLVIGSFVSLGFVSWYSFRHYFLTWNRIATSQKRLLYSLVTSYGKWEFVRPLAGKFESFVRVWLTKIFLGTEIVAIFSVAQTMVSTIGSFLPVSTLSVLVPVQINDKEKMQKIYNTGSKYLFLLSICMSLFGLIVAFPFIHSFFPKYISALPLFSLMLIPLPISALSTVASIFLTVYRRQGFLLFQKILKTIIGVILFVILVPTFGVWGLAIQGLILSIILYSVIFIYIKKSNIGVSVNVREIFSLGESDRVFFKSAYSDFRRYINYFLPAFLKKR